MVKFISTQTVICDTPRVYELLQILLAHRESARLLRRIILANTNKEDSIVDPFTGSSTNGITAVSEGRRFISFDKRAQILGTLKETIRQSERPICFMKIVTRAEAIANLKAYIGKDLHALAAQYGISTYETGRQNKDRKDLILGRLAGLTTGASLKPICLRC